MNSGEIYMSRNSSGLTPKGRDFTDEEAIYMSRNSSGLTPLQHI